MNLSTTRTVTRADVAKLAGVSTAVVSYVVNGGPRPVAEATAVRVRDAIDVLGYRPNATARALKLGTTGVLGLVVPDSSNPFYAELALEVERAASARGLALLMASSNADLELEQRLIEDLLARQVDGLLVSGTAGAVVPSRMATVRPSGPIVFLDCPIPLAGFTTLCSDAFHGGQLLTEHLLQEHHHESVALVMGTSTEGWRDNRELGWSAALQAAGAKPGAVVRVAFTRQGGYEAGRELLARADRPSAVFASSDLQAVGLLRAAHELGLNVPGDLAVVAYDGTQEAAFCWPPLTCARQRISAIADAGVVAVADRAEPEHRVFDVEFVVRHSCGCP